MVAEKIRRIIKQRTVASLARRLPEYSVFDSGRFSDFECITIRLVIAQDVVLAHAPILVDAARQFRRIAYELIALLAEKLCVPVSALSNEKFRFSLRDDQYHGNLDGNWSYSFHGYECRFHNSSTKQMLDVKLGYPDEWGVLDSYYFHKFLETTPEYEGIATLFVDSNHDMARTLDILAKAGLLRLIAHRSGGKWKSYVARE